MSCTHLICRASGQMFRNCCASFSVLQCSWRGFMRQRAVVSLLLGFLTVVVPVATGKRRTASGQFPGGVCVNGGSCNPSDLTRVIYVDSVNYTLPSAVEAANRSGHTIILVRSNQTLSGGLTLSGEGVQLICLNNAALIAGAGDFWMLTIAGTDDMIGGCTLSPGRFPTSKALLVQDATTPRIETVTIAGFHSGNGLIFLVGAKGPVIRNSRLITGPGGPDGIFGQINTTDADVEGNFVDESLGGARAHAIAFHSTIRGKSVSGTKITNNIILAGLNFCVEVGPFGGLTPSQVAVSENECKLTENGGSGGYSLVVEDSTEMNNAFDANGFTATIAAYEIVLSTNLTAKGNIAQIGRAWTTVTTSAVTINQSRDVKFVDNVIKGWGGGDAMRNSGFGVEVISASVDNAIVQDNFISGNVLVFPAGQHVGGIFQQCDAKGAICSHNRYANNVLIGDATRDSVAIRLENDAGTTADTVISDNTFVGVQYGVYIWNPDVTGTRVCHNSNHATVEVVDHGKGIVVCNHPL
jgi:hypothetical protein